MSPHTATMNELVDTIARRAGVKRTSVKIEFAPTDDDDDMPWIVRIAMRHENRRTKRFSDAYGYGATVTQAGAEAIADVAKYEAIGFKRAESAVCDGA